MMKNLTYFENWNWKEWLKIGWNLKIVDAQGAI